MPKRMHIVETDDFNIFHKECNALLDRGYELFSTNLGYTNDYTCYQAVFLFDTYPCFVPGCKGTCELVRGDQYRCDTCEIDMGHCIRCDDLKPGSYIGFCPDCKELLDEKGTEDEDQ